LSFVLSAYREYLKQQSGSLTDFIGTGQEGLSFYPIFREDYAEYDVAIAGWQDRFGASNVLVLPFELLHTSPDLYFTRLAEFAQVAPFHPRSMERRNKGRGGAALQAGRIINKFVARSPLSQKLSLSARIALRGVGLINKTAPTAVNKHIETRWKDQIAQRYPHGFAPSNTRLSALIDTDLAELGYRCES